MEEILVAAFFDELEKIGSLADDAARTYNKNLSNSIYLAARAAQQNQR